MPVCQTTDTLTQRHVSSESEALAVYQYVHMETWF